MSCVDGRARRYVNLDNAASTPVMADVWAAVEAFVPWYSSVHRGSGAKSRVSTAAFEDARADVAGFVGARADDRVVFVRNTTEAINVMAAALPAGTRVLSSPAEHHANMLPWRRHDVRLLPFASSAQELLEACERALREARFDLVAVTGASNVTGEIWPAAELAAIAHRHGAELFVDAAQLAPHRPIDMAGSGIDHLALSGHKLYAPFGAGALVAGAARLEAGAPLLRGGGAVKLVTPDDVIWEDAPERHEAGSPDVVGAVALAAACRRLLPARHGDGRGARAGPGRAAVGRAELPSPDSAPCASASTAARRRRAARSPVLSAQLGRRAARAAAPPARRGARARARRAVEAAHGPAVPAAASGRPGAVRGPASRLGTTRTTSIA